MNSNFNSYIECPAVEYWKKLCMNDGVLIHFNSGDYFFREGEVARYFGFIQSGTLKYTAYVSPTAI